MGAAANSGVALAPTAWNEDEERTEGVRRLASAYSHAARIAADVFVHHPEDSAADLAWHLHDLHNSDGRIRRGTAMVNEPYRTALWSALGAVEVPPDQSGEG